MDNFIAACIERSRAVMLLLFTIFIIGTIAYVEIPKEENPDIQIPNIYVVIRHDGISPEDAERLLVRPMEIELRSIEGLKEMISYASEGRASISLEFNAGFNSDKAIADVREKVDMAKVKLPDNTEEPEIKEVNLSLFPVINVIITGEVPTSTLIAIAKRLRDKVEEIPNVLEADIAGDREDAVEIIVDPVVLEGYGLTLSVLDKVANGFNRLIAAGSIDSRNGSYAVKVPGLLENIGDILSLPLKTNGNTVIKIGDVASIRKTYKDPQGFARANGKQALVLEVSKRTGTNIIETIEQVKEVISEETRLLPDAIKITYSQDKSAHIRDMLSDLQNNIVFAVLLVMIVIIYFVGIRSALLISISIPGAFLIGIMAIYYMGMTVNIVVLFSLILSVGMLVDAAIIVCEMADRKIAEGTNHVKAYLESASYMKWPIISSTATTLIVFMPLLFWPGIVGGFMKYMPITLIATLTGSLIMAIIFIPVLGALFGKTSYIDKKAMGMFQITEQGNLNELTGFTGLYCRTLGKVIHNFKTSALFAIIIIGVLIAAVFMFVVAGKGTEFFPDIEPDNSIIKIKARGNLSVYEKDELVREVEKRVLDMDNEIKVFYARSGVIGGNKNNDDTIGTISIEYNNWRLRRKAAEIKAEIINRTKNIGGIIVEVQDEKGGPKSDKPIEFEIGARDPALLEPAAQKIIKAMEEIGGFTDIEDSRPVPSIEWKMDLSREKAGLFGVDINMIGAYIKLVTNGMLLNKYRPDDSDDEVDIIARFPDDKRNITTLDALKIITDKGNVPVSNFITREAKQKTGTIRRSDGYRVINIRSNVAKGVLPNEKIMELHKYFMQSGEIDHNINIRFKGDNENQQETADFLDKAFVIAILFMILILVIQFNSIYYTFIILTAIFLSSAGVLLGLLITNQPFGIVMCGVGIIALAGIVVNNNIIFIDTYQKLVDEGMDYKEAIMRTATQRLRPILLTAGTTVLGLIPMVMGMNIDFIEREVVFGAPSGQWWKQLSTSIAGGLSFATILTLFFTPSLLMIGKKFSYIAQKFKGKVFRLQHNSTAD